MIVYFIKKGIRLEGLKVILIIVDFNCRRCYLNVIDGLRLSLEDELNDGEKAHEEDEDEDDDEEVDGDSIVRFHDSSDRNAEDDHPKNLKMDLDWI